MHSPHSYRMHLWGKMAQQQAAQRQNQAASQSPSPPSATSGLASNVRPHFFNKSSTLSALLSGKAASSSASSTSQLLTPYPSTSIHLGASAKADTPTAQQAMLANIASQTLFSKLGGAFWDAFARPSGSHGANGAKQEWDADKVRRVMEGTAVVRVVDVEPQPAPRAPTALAAQKQEKDCCKACHGVVTDLLAESMASLTISKKQASA